jgi:hypothetical protein
MVDLKSAVYRLQMFYSRTCGTIRWREIRRARSYYRYFNGVFGNAKEFFAVQVFHLSSKEECKHTIGCIRNRRLSLGRLIRVNRSFSTSMRINI